MKKILFTLLLVLGISAAADAQVRFLDSSTDAVRKEAIAQDKLVDLNCFTIEAAMTMVAGTARSMGIAVKGDFPGNN